MSSFSELESTAKKLTGFQASLLGSFDLSGILALSESHRDFAKKLEANSKSFAVMLNSKNFATLLEEMGRETPYNYENFMIDDQYTLIEMSRVGNFGTIEVMPRAVIEKLLKVEGSEIEVDKELLLNKNEIIDKVFELVQAFLEFPQIEDYGFLLGRSLEALSGGHYEASQTLSTALWDSFLSERAGRKAPMTAIKGEAEKPDIQAIEGFSPIYNYGAFGPALSAYQAPGNRSKYSRDGTIHHLSSTSANQLNAIKAITIAGGVIGRSWRTLPNA
jgi:hypothetical protein